MMTESTNGRSYPLGVSLRDDGANFCIFSLHASSMELLFFEGPNDARPNRVIPLDPLRNTTFCYWHVFVPGVKAGQLYAYRAFGPFEPSEGHRYDGSKVLLDPYAGDRPGQELLA